MEDCYGTATAFRRLLLKQQSRRAALMFRLPSQQQSLPASRKLDFIIEC